LIERQPLLNLDTSTGQLRYEAAGCRIAAWTMAIEVNGQRLESVDAELEMLEDPPCWRLTFADAGLRWDLTAAEEPDQGTVVLRSTLTNLADAPLILGQVVLLDTEARVALGDGSDILVLPLPGELGERCVWSLSDPECPRPSKIKVQLYSPAARRALQVGFLTFHRANTEVDYDLDPERGLAGLRARCDFAGWELPPGETATVETLIVAAGTDPHAQLESWADRAAALGSPRRWEDAPIGWVGWAWVDPFNVETYEDVVVRNCQAIRRRLAGFGVDHVWVSIGNLAEGTPGRWLEWNHECFPSGPQYLARRLGELGFRWGLWCGVFWICASAEAQMEEMQDALLRHPDGSLLVVRPEWQFGAAGDLPRAERPCMYALDPSHPKALTFLRDTFETYRLWGVRYYMLDFLHAGAGNISSFPYEDHADRSVVAGPEAYHRALRVVREAAGDDTYFLSSTGPSVHNTGLVDAIRTGNDFGEGRALYSESYFYPATFVINSGGFWTGPRCALQNQASAWYTHRRLYINDSGNVLTVDAPLPLEDARLHATIHAFSGGPSMIGDDVDRMDEERLALIKKTLPRPRDVAFPVDLFDSPHPDYPRIFHRRVDHSWGRFDVVAVYNFGDDLLSERVPLERLDLSADADYLVWEFWNARYEGRVRGALEATVPPGTVRVFRLVEDPGAPVLLGSDMHLLMGEVEVLDCRYDPESLTLSGTALRPAGERGNLYLHAPPDLCVADPRVKWIAKDARDNSLIVRLSLSFGGDPAEWQVSFAPLGTPLDMRELDLT